MNVVELEDAALLSLEDNPSSVIEVVGYLKRHGADVVEVPDVDGAEAVVRRKQFDGILLDVRVPNVKGGSHRGGIAFIQALKRGQFGDLNRHVPFVVLTSFIHEINLAEVADLPGFTGPVIAKQAATPTDITKALGIKQPPSLGANEPYFVDAMLTVGSPPEHGQVLMEIDSWPEEGLVRIPEGELPVEVRQEFEYDDFPVYVWARVNLDAKSVEELMPTHFRLSVARPEDLRAFDEGETLELGS